MLWGLNRLKFGEGGVSKDFFFFVLVFRVEAQEVCEQFEKVQNQDS